MVPTPGNPAACLRSMLQGLRADFAMRPVSDAELDKLVVGAAGQLALLVRTPADGQRDRHRR